MKTNFCCVEDENEFYKAFGDILNLFGKNKFDLILEAFQNRFGYVKSYPFGSENKKVNSITPGKSGYIEDINNKMYLEFIGFKNSPNKEQTKHYIRHELVHIFETVAHDALSNDKKISINNFSIPIFDTYKINDREFSAINGTIYRKMQKDEKNNVIYGTGFCELFTDILAILSMVSFDDKYKKQSITADTVIKDSIEDWNVNNITTGYMNLLPLLRLMIAAFSNYSNINYQKLIETKTGILFETKEGKIINDFIYGCICDPFYIMNECDKISGQSGYYFKLSEKIDKLVNDCADKKEYNIDDVNDLIQEISQIVDRRIKIKIVEKELSIEEGNAILEEFEHIKHLVKNDFIKSKNL